MRLLGDASVPDDPGSYKLHTIGRQGLEENVAHPPLVSVLGLGGTIAMASPDSPADGVRPALDAGALVAAVPGLQEVARVRARSLQVVPGASLGFADVLGCLDAVRAEVDTEAVGVVVTQGTDTLEECAYLLDLLWDRDEPLVVTGAMRHPGQPGADGPANLLAATAVAAAGTARGRGVLVVMDDDVHPARYVIKRHSSSTGAFVSVDAGPIGRVLESTPVFLATVPRHPALPTPAPTANPRVALVEATLDDRGELLRLAGEAGYDGVVLGAFGVGHVATATAEIVSDLAGRIPVVFTSRTGAGGTARSTYGFVGSERDLLARGAIGAGFLDARKARILLWALLAGGAGDAEIRAAFAVRGGKADPRDGGDHYAGAARGCAEEEP